MYDLDVAYLHVLYTVHINRTYYIHDIVDTYIDYDYFVDHNHHNAIVLVVAVVAVVVLMNMLVVVVLMMRMVLVVVVLMNMLVLAVVLMMMVVVVDPYLNNFANKNEEIRICIG